MRGQEPAYPRAHAAARSTAHTLELSVILMNHRVPIELAAACPLPSPPAPTAVSVAGAVAGAVVGLANLKTDSLMR